MRMNITLPALIAANLVAIVFVLGTGRGLQEALWIYWLQSVIIGFFSYKRILALKEFSATGVNINGSPVLAGFGTKAGSLWGMPSG